MKKLFDLHRKFKMPTLCAFLSMMLVMSMVMSVTFVAEASHPARVVDEAGILTEDEEQELLLLVDEISERQQFDVVVAAVNTLNGEDIQYFAADYYDYNGYGMGENYDGAMFLLSMEEREWFILSTGYGIEVLKDKEIDAIGSEAASYLSAGAYFDAFSVFAKSIDAEVTAGVEETKPSLLLAVFAGLILGLIPAFVMRGKLKSVKMQAGAGGYENRGGRKLTTKQDVFLYHTISRTPRPSENSSSGSSTFTGSSGRSHGGRGGGF